VTDTIDLDITLGANQTWRAVKRGATLHVAGMVSGNFHLVKAGAGTLVLEAVNDYNV
jgi:hypothetical protein